MYEAMTPLVIESWIWWAVVFLVALSRFISRRMVFGSFKGFQSDDYVMMVVLLFYTTLIPTINIVRNSDSNLLPPGFDMDSLTDHEIARREQGSKLILVVEQCQIVTIWGAKVCLMILYLRLTTLRGEHIAIKVLFGYVILTFIVMEVLYFGYWCRPFSNYWAVPTPNVQCNAATNHLILNAVFNLSSDIFMLAVGLPMFLRLNLPWQKKYPIIAVFSLGIFVILAAILNKVYSFTQPFGSLWTFWYVRESSTALLVANLPFVWNFWRRLGGFSSVIGGSKKGTTRAVTAVNTAPRHASVPKEHELPGFITEWPQQDEKEGDDTLQRTSSRRPSAKARARSEDHEMSLEEALGISNNHEQRHSASVIKEAHVRDAPGCDSSSATTHSATPASLNGPSWSAGSFV